MAQPKMGVVRWMLGRTFYPDNEWTRDRDGDPIRPYDMATDTMAEFMGVRADRRGPCRVKSRAHEADRAACRSPAGTARPARRYAIDGRLNDSFRAVNLLLDKGVAVRRVSQRIGRAGTTLRRAISSWTPRRAARPRLPSGEADRRGLHGAQERRDAGADAIKRLRIAMYKRYGGGNMDEGWTRFTLEQFGFPYTSIFDAEIKKGGLEANYDVIILPADTVRR